MRSQQNKNQIARYLFLLFIFVPQFLSAQSLSEFKTMPTYREVVTKFCARYDVPYFEGENILSFRKKYGVWEVYRHHYRTNEIVEDEVFYSKGKFHKLTKFTRRDEAKPGSRSKTYDQLVAPRFISDYRRHPFYGYPGFAQDAIEFLAPLEDQLDDSLHYGLGRCYSHLAHDYLAPQYSYSNISKVTFTHGGSCISKEQEDKVRAYFKKSQYHFARAMDLNPNYCVVVGRMRTKYENEIMDERLALFPFTSYESAFSHIPSNLYTEDMLAMAKSYLNNCPQNAILFTNSDNDTYPVLFLQSVKKYRTDVAVINLSLLATEHYRDAMTRPPYNLVYSLPVAFYDHTLRYLSIMDDENNDSMSLDEFRKHKGGDVLYHKKITINRNNTSYAFQLKKRYIDFGNIALLDIVQSNPDRPISLTFTGANGHILEDYLALKGLNWEFMESRKTPRYDLETTLKFLQEELDLSGFDDVSNFTVCEYYNSSLIRYQSTGIYINVVINQALQTINHELNFDEPNTALSERILKELRRIDDQTWFPLLTKHEDRIEKLREVMRNKGGY
jgi:hypothetical protein